MQREFTTGSGLVVSSLRPAIVILLFLYRQFSKCVFIYLKSFNFATLKNSKIKIVNTRISSYNSVTIMKHTICIS